MPARLRLALIGIALFSGAAPAASPPAVSPCSDVPRLHALDFWFGRWSVHAENEVVGRNLIEPILSGCAVIERWRDVRGSEGLSLFYYDLAQDLWKQVWVTDDALRTGGTKEKVEQKHLTGPDRMRFQGRYSTRSGTEIVDRTTLTLNANGTVRQLIEISTDGGKTWRATFDALYRRESTNAAAERARLKDEEGALQALEAASRAGPTQPVKSRSGKESRTGKR